MKALSLFSGIGGIDLAAEWAGIETVAMCEREPFCQKVLAKHWPNIPIYEDVCTLTKERLEADGIGTIGLIFGGYPCQPFSTAGERKGEGDDRHLWPEVKRLLETIKPNWFIGENVAGHVSLGLDDVLVDLGNIGYTVQSFIIPASSVGAIHRRNRVFIVANTDSIGCVEYERFAKTIQPSWHQELQRNKSEKPNLQQSIYGTETHDTNTNRNGLQGMQQEKIQREQVLQRDKTDGRVKEWTRRSVFYEPKLCGNSNGFPNGVDRIKSLGNAVVPEQIYPILAAIKQIDDIMRAG